MPRQIFIKPLSGNKIRDPFRSGKPHLKPEGEWKPDVSYWRRRVKFKEAEIVDSPKDSEKVSEEDEKYFEFSSTKRSKGSKASKGGEG